MMFRPKAAWAEFSTEILTTASLNELAADGPFLHQINRQVNEHVGLARPNLFIPSLAMIRLALAFHTKPFLSLPTFL